MSVSVLQFKLKLESKFVINVLCIFSDIVIDGHVMSDVWSRAWCETQNVPNFALKGKLGNFSSV